MRILNKLLNRPFNTSAITSFFLASFILLASNATAANQSDSMGSTANTINPIVAVYGGHYENRRLEAIVQQTLKRLSQENSDYSNITVTFIDYPAPRSWNSGEKNLYLSTGLLFNLNTTNELAAILALEAQRADYSSDASSDNIKNPYSLNSKLRFPADVTESLLASSAPVSKRSNKKLRKQVVEDLIEAKFSKTALSKLMRKTLAEKNLWLDFVSRHQITAGATNSVASYERLIPGSAKNKTSKLYPAQSVINKQKEAYLHYLAALKEYRSGNRQRAKQQSNLAINTWINSPRLLTLHARIATNVQHKEQFLKRAIRINNGSLEPLLEMSKLPATANEKYHRLGQANQTLASNYTEYELAKLAADTATDNDGLKIAINAFRQVATRYPNYKDATKQASELQAKLDAQLAEEEKQRQIAAELERQRLAEEERQRQIAAEKERQRLAEEERQRQIAADKERQRLAEEERQRQLKLEQERQAELEKQRRLEAQRKEQERLAALEAERQRLAEEQRRKEAEMAAKLEAQRLERLKLEAEQRKIAEEKRLQRIAAERLEQERARLKAAQEAAAKAEEEARAAQAKLAAEKAQREAAEEARLQAEKAAQEAEKQRLAAEYAAKLAEEQRAKEIAQREQLEAMRRAAEERKAKEEAELAKQKAAAEQAAREATEKLAAEKEAQRLAEEQEARRIAEEQKAQRIAAEKEAQRLAEEKEAQRLAEEKAQQAAAKKAAEAEEENRLFDDAKLFPANHIKMSGQLSEYGQLAISAKNTLPWPVTKIRVAVLEGNRNWVVQIEEPIASEKTLTQATALGPFDNRQLNNMQFEITHIEIDR